MLLAWNTVKPARPVSWSVTATSPVVVLYKCLKDLRDGVISIYIFTANTGTISQISHFYYHF